MLVCGNSGTRDVFVWPMEVDGVEHGVHVSSRVSSTNLTLAPMISSYSNCVAWIVLMISSRVVVFYFYFFIL